MTPAELAERYGLTAADLVVEVGSGDGSRLRAVRALGPRVLGIEPDVRLMARASWSFPPRCARMIASLIEEAEAIGWYEQRMAVESDPEARAIMANAQKEEFKHFGMNLEFLCPKTF